MSTCIKIILPSEVLHDHLSNQVKENVAAAVQLGTNGKDEKTLAEIEDILRPVKNQTWRNPAELTVLLLYVTVCILYLHFIAFQLPVKARQK
ncbi:hypothetical protein ACFX2I_034920 [Malus domestica]